MTKRILVVDDDPSVADVIQRALAATGHEVSIAKDGREALRLLFADKPDLVLLDIAMPVMDGWETCSRIREMSDLPIIMITGTQKSEDDIVRGIDCGADDYLLKPVSSEVLIAKIRAVLRRAELSSALDASTATYSDAYLTIDLLERKIIVNGERMKLTPTEFHLLANLVKNAGRTLSHKQLLQETWGWEYVDDIDYVRIYISRLRRKIEPDHHHPTYVITESGVGYYFNQHARTV